MFKKLLVTGAAAAMVFGSVAGVFASTTVSNRGDIRNVSVNVANTGLNAASGHHRSSVTTGDAVATQVTTNEVVTSASCGCTSGRRGGTTVRNSGDVTNLSVNVANTGLNRGGSVSTGNAAAGQDVLNVVNTSVGSSI